MTPYYRDDWLTIYQGDVRAVLPELASDSVDCVVTSPPYWGLRDYGTATWEGGDAECDHSAQRASSPKNIGAGMPLSDRDCGKCGATRIDSQLGLEATPEEYVANMVEVFREVRRVLKPSGTCWLNLGDSYGAANNRNGQRSASLNDGRADFDVREATKYNQGTYRLIAGLKPKDLVGIPWRVAFALQADGWYLRSDIIWAKPNPMPESVTDRPTKSHEYLFLLTKSARYYFDADAVREPATGHDPGTLGVHDANKFDRSNGNTNGMGKTSLHTLSAGRNLRSVWTIATRPYPGAHFAVFPPELPERCIKAGSSERGVCPECGAPWERVVEHQRGPIAEVLKPKDEGRVAQGLLSRKTGLSQPGWRKEPIAASTTTGWQPTCDHDAKPVPAVVLDPFAGSGTTGMVANRLSRRAILIDLNGDYLKQQLTRNAQTPLGLGA